MKITLNILRQFCRRSIKKEDRKRFSTYILAMITYIRQSVVVPILPIANITLEMSNINEMRSELSVILMNEFKKLNLKNFLENEESAKSTRIKEVIKIIKNHRKSTDKITVFSCFCTSLDMTEYYVNEEIGGIDIFKLKSTMNIKARGKLVKDFTESKNNSILFTSYTLGAAGLNLQAANVVVILDFWWNTSMIQQAISRVIRTGQKSSAVDVYFLSSNTGIEKALFGKQQDKEILLDEIKKGEVKSTVKVLKMEEVLRLIDSQENSDYIARNYM